MGTKILAIDDDAAFLRLVETVLVRDGHQVLKAQSGQEGLKLLFEHKPSLVLLDVVMPEMDGWKTCQRIRELSDVPVIMLTGKQTTEEDVVRGLDFGADEYLMKPVGNRELLARVRAVLRRAETLSSSGEQKAVTYSDDLLTVNIAERRVLVKGEPAKLTPIEFRLFAFLVDNAGRILTHRQILERVWGWEYSDDVDYVRIYISHLRQKIEPDPVSPRYILTEPGVGYYFQKRSA